MSKILFHVLTEPVVLNDDGSVEYMGELTIDADGGRRTYAPLGSGLKPLDYLANAGKPGNWWGIATDSTGKPIIQGKNDPAPGYYVSTTSLKMPGFKHGDPRREIDSETVPFIAIPSQLIKAVKPVVMGCKAIVTDAKTGKQVEAIVADAGPRDHLGEGSIALAKALVVPSDPKKGGSSQVRFKYQIYPGVQATINGVTYPLQPSK